MTYVAIPFDSYSKRLPDELSEGIYTHAQFDPKQQVKCDLCGLVMRPWVVWLKDGKVHCSKCRREK